MFGNVTGNVSGSSGSCTGNSATATKLATPRAIGGVSFDGTSSINLPGVNQAGNQNTSGNAATATALATPRTIGGVSFNGTASIDLPGVNTSGNQDTSGNAATASGLVLSNSSTLDGDDVASKAYVSSAVLNATPDLSSRLATDGSNSMTGGLNGTTAIFSGQVDAQSFNATSDIALKRDINVIGNALDMINNLNGISWNWKSDGTASMGVSAQDVEAVAPQLVGQGEYKSVNYNGLVGVLVEAVKTLSAEVRELKNK